MRWKLAARVALAAGAVPEEFAAAPEAVGLAVPAVARGRLTEMRALTVRSRPRIELDPGASADFLTTTDATSRHQPF